MNKFSCLCKINKAVAGVNAYSERYIDVRAATKDEAKDICMHLLVVENVISVYSFEELNACFKPNGALQDELAQLPNPRDFVIIAT